MSNQYIVDASVVVQLLVTDAHSVETKALFTSVKDGNKLIVPEFGLLECTNVLWKHVRFHGLQPVDAEKQIHIMLALDMVIVPAVGLMPHALEIGLKHQLAVYDSIYIALAEKLNLPLITVDQKQSKVAQAENIVLKPITDFKR